MINLEKSINNFIKYTENYDLENENIKGKQQHSLRVMELSNQISKRLYLTSEKIQVATLIGLLHDIARFEQYTKYKTFKDYESIDHGNLGEEILQKDIRKYIEKNEYDNLIFKAVKNHNKYQIEEGLTEEEKLQAQIIRDADKIDIFYESAELFWKGKEQEIENSIITEQVVNQIRNLKQIKKQDAKTAIDDIIKVIALIFDINFKESFQIIKEKDYINRIIDRYNIKDTRTKQEVEKIRKIANEYIENKL